jgi:hypothetical protein
MVLETKKGGYVPPYLYCYYLGGLICPPSPPVSSPGGGSPGSPGSASAVFTVVVPPQDAEWFVFDGLTKPNNMAIKRGINITQKFKSEIHGRSLRIVRRGCYGFVNQKAF